MLGAGIIERKQLLVRLVNAADYIDNYNAVADFCCGFNTVGKARFDFGFDNKAVDNNLDIMLLSFFQLDFIRQIEDFAVNSHADKALFLNVLKFLDKLAFFTFCNRSQNLNFCPFREEHNLVNDLVNRLRRNFPAANGTMRNTDSCPMQTTLGIDCIKRKA